MRFTVLRDGLGSVARNARASVQLQLAPDALRGLVEGNEGFVDFAVEGKPSLRRRRSRQTSPAERFEACYHRRTTMLPNEGSVRAELARAHNSDFANMHSLQALAVSVIDPRITIRQSVGIVSTVVYVRLGLYVKACRQFRSIQLLCEAGIGSDAHALTRNLFETSLALLFVARRRVTLKRNGKRIGRVGKRALGSRLRARLYLANVQFEAERTLGDWERTPGLKRSAARSFDAVGIRGRSADAAQIIGVEWTKRLRDQKSYSGLNLREWAVSLGLAQPYAIVYRSGPWSTHATDLQQFVTRTDSGSELLLEPSSDLIPQSIYSASRALLTCLDVMNDRFRLGLDSKLSPHKERLWTRSA